MRELERPKRDLSDLLGRIDIACLLLENLETGYWWNAELCRRRLTHPEVRSWLSLYNFSDLADLPADALAAFCLSVERHLKRLQALPTEPIAASSLPASDAPAP